MNAPSSQPARRVIRRGAFAIAAVGFTWAGWLLVFGGFDTEPFGIRIRSNDPLRPFVAACLALALFVLLGGRLQMPQFRFLRRHARVFHAIQTAAGWRPPEWTMVAVLSVAVTVFGIAYGTTVGGGSDSYGYVSQADLWLAGDLEVEQPWVEEATWDSRRWSFAPLGYRARDDDFTIVPTYSPGLALLMAGTKAIAGQEGMFWVVPLLGGALVLATFGVARRVAPADAALTATWLTATCPAMLYMIVQPMSDVPVAGLWLSACYFVLRREFVASAAGGFVAAIAILVRPNLVYLAAIIGAWPLWRALLARESRGRGLGQMLVFGVCASSGAFTVAAINNYLYGSPAVSGYGDISSMFDVSHLWPNLVKYAAWLIESETVVAAAGAVALVLPWRRLWPEAEHRRFLPIAAGVVGSVWIAYCLYLEFDAWWYLRFMLPVLPFIAIGMAVVAAAIRRASGRATGAVVTIAVVLLGVLQFRFAVDNSALEMWRGERRYVSVGRLVRAQTPENSMIISNQHSGSLRYYGGRMTLRFDNLDGDSLDEAIAWLKSRGVRPYLLVEEGELPAFRERFAGQAALELLDTPMSIYDGPGTAMLFDLMAPTDGEPVKSEDTLEGLRSVPPAPPPTIVLQPAK